MEKTSHFLKIKTQKPKNDAGYRVFPVLAESVNTTYLSENNS